MAKAKEEFDAVWAAEPVCNAIDKLIAGLPREQALAVLDELIAYGEDRYEEIDRKLPGGPK